MDEDIKRHFQCGEHSKAFELLMDSYQNKVFRLAYSFLRNETAAQDITQDVFLKIWLAFPKFEGETAFSSWIYTICRNTCLSEIKRNRYRKISSLHDPDVEKETEAVHFRKGTEGRQSDVAALLSMLPENYRQILTLFYLEEKSYEEVSQMLEIPIGTVKTNLHRAKRQLAELVEKRRL